MQISLGGPVVRRGGEGTVEVGAKIIGKETRLRKIAIKLESATEPE